MKTLISNKVILVLLAAMAILTTICAVLLGFQGLLSSLHDAAAARVLQWIGLACMILLITDIMLLVGALSVRALEQDRDASDDS